MAQRMPQADLLLALPGGELLRLSPAELRWRFSRSSGPGGQNVNTTDSRVELRFDLAGCELLPPPLKARALGRLADQLVDGQVQICASEHRSQWQNRVAAQRRLLALLEQALKPPPPPRRPSRATRGSVQRRLEAKARRGAVKRLRSARIEEPPGG